MTSTDLAWGDTRGPFGPRLPFDAEFSAAKQRMFQETAVFVHHFGGDRRSSLRHVRLLNDLGVDCVRFSLSPKPSRPGRGGFVWLRRSPPIAADLRWGLRGVWADQIEGVLNAIPGRKLLYCFSMPSASAIEALGRRRASDVSALVCDGGPFARLAECTWNLYEREYEVQSRVARAAFVGASMLLWGLGFQREMRRSLLQIPRGFSVLSIRGDRHQWILAAAIEDFWRMQDHLDVRRFLLPQGAHLDGLRRFPEEYAHEVERFLSQKLTPA